MRLCFMENQNHPARLSESEREVIEAYRDRQREAILVDFMTSAWTWQMPYLTLTTQPGGRNTRITAASYGK